VTSPASPLYVRLANGVTVVSKDTCSAVVCFAQDVQQVIRFRVVPELSVPVVLGMGWLKDTDPSIVWSTGQVSFTHEGKAVTVNGLHCNLSLAKGEAVKIDICGYCSMLKGVRKGKTAAWYGLLHGAG
jgi:hypothetical protein